MKFAIHSIVTAGAVLAFSSHAFSQAFQSGDLVVSRSVYTGANNANGNPLAAGDALPSVNSGNTPFAANADGSYPNVFNNESVDANFGVTSPIYLDELNLNANGSAATVQDSRNVTALFQSSLGFNLTTSFPSKSELAINLSSDGTSLTFMAYNSVAGAMDISNSNTPAVIDSTNNDHATPTYRVAAQINANGTVNATPTSAYSGNNGRATVLENGNFYIVGNAGNSGSGVSASTLSTLSDNSGVQMVSANAPGVTTPAALTVVGKVNGTFGSTTGYQRGFSIANVQDPTKAPGTNYAADKTGKDDNFRGLTVFNNTLYVTKGSGSNGINTVFQVGTTGSLPTAANAGTTPISVLPGFSTVSAKSTNTAAIQHPFGLWFANADTLYVADEGDGVLANASSNNPNAGLQKWTFDGTTWTEAYNLTNGLNLGVGYTVAGYPTGTNSVTGNPWTLETDGLRNITGRVNADGTVTIFGITSTVSGSVDNGADPNELVSITDTLADTTIGQASGESFTTLETAANGQVLRGVSFAPTAVPEPAANGIILSFAVVGLAVLRRFKLRQS